MRTSPTRSARALRTQNILAAIIPAAILTLSITGFVWAQKQATVVVDGASLQIDSQAADVAGLLSQAGVTVGSGDLVFPSQDTRLVEGMSVVVRHAIPVTVVLGGAENRLNVVGQTVADALIAAGVDPASNTAVVPSLDTPLTANMVINAPDCFSRVIAVTQPVPFKVEQRTDKALPLGTRKIVTPGADGSVLRVYRALVVGGVEGSSTLTTEKVISQPVNQVIAVGAADSSDQHQLAVAEIKPSVRLAAYTKSGRKLHVVTTAYSGIEPGAGGSSTASGRRAERGVVAVDPDVIPLGTHLYIPGYGYAIAGDTGGMINGNHIDLCFDSMAEVNAWGKRHLTITILD
jgi:uncharacterized protein YabE (DUF348 family)